LIQKGPKKSRQKKPSALQAIFLARFSVGPLRFFDYFNGEGRYFPAGKLRVKSGKTMVAFRGGRA
jgi:hypothetical protein